MTFYIVQRQEIDKLVQAVVIDNRVALGLGNANGNVIQPYVDNIVNSINNRQSFFVIESNEGNLAAYFYLNEITGALEGKNYRPQFSSFYTQFDAMISAFIASGEWQYSVLV